MCERLLFSIKRPGGETQVARCAIDILPQRFCCGAGLPASFLFFSFLACKREFARISWRGIPRASCSARRSIEISNFTAINNRGCAVRWAAVGSNVAENCLREVEITFQVFFVFGLAIM